MGKKNEETRRSYISTRERRVKVTGRCGEKERERNRPCEFSSVLLHPWPPHLQAVFPGIRQGLPGSARSLGPCGASLILGPTWLVAGRPGWEPAPLQCNNL